MRMDEETWCEGQMVLSFEGVMPCMICGSPQDWDEDEPCDSCMNPEMPREYGPGLLDSEGNDRGWQDSTFPNEY